jgi:hypothetical protein
MAKQTFTTGQTLTAAQMNTLQANDYNMTVTTGTASYTLQASDKGQRRVQNMGSAGTVTVPNSVFDAGDALWIHSIGSGLQTVAAGTGLTLNSSAGSAPTLAQWEGGVVYFTSASSAIFFRGGAVATASVEYLVVGGGGSGGGNIFYTGGGGAGGYLAGTLTTVPRRVNLTVTVGAGGSVPASGTTQGANGSLSQFHTIIALGGGGGGNGLDTQITLLRGKDGGSGGGANSTSGGAGLTVLSNASTQGNNGGLGAGTFQVTVQAGGGGGGSGAVGGNAANSGAGGNGGNGTANSITGSSVTYAGGGGGSGNTTGGTGGTGGGGNNGVAGTANTGGGGGGNANGGSGIVILKYADSLPPLTVGAGLTQTNSTSGGFRIYSFTAGTGTVSL